MTNPKLADELTALHIIFDGPPGPEAGRFVEVETPDGYSVNAGEWHERTDGFWELRISPTILAALTARSDGWREGVEAAARVAEDLPLQVPDSHASIYGHADDIAAAIRALTPETTT